MTYVIFSYITANNFGLGSYDRKQLADSVQFVAIPALLAGSINWKLDLLLSLPLTLIGTVLNVNGSYANEGDNLACFANPNAVASHLGARLIFVYLMVAASMHSQRKFQVKSFEQEEDAKQS